ncbi:hypothetical protein HZA41_00365 [Candidatus Peregrinibacteria bacterium]|nr:hypothetical protein [Candidatus Peregrinibacteria bacterium]
MQEADKIIHETFVSCGAKAKEWTRKCLLMLPEIEKREIWRKKGFGSIYEYSAKLAGLSRNSVDDALRILRKIEDKPALKKIVEEKGIGAVRPVAVIATQGTDAFWAEKARMMSKNTLETYVREIRKISEATTDLANLRGNMAGTDNTPIEKIRPRTESQPDIAMRAIHGHATNTIIMNLAPDIAEKLMKLKGAGTWNDLMRTLLSQHEAQMEAEKPIPVETESRHIPVKIKKYVLAKTNGTCAFPGCVKQHEILHHTERFALSKCHNPDHIAPLCKAHERLAHLSLIKNEEFKPSHWKIRRKPETHDLKYLIDQRVAEHRNVAASSPPS